MIRIPSQQSAVLSQLAPDDEKCLRQLSLPQVNDALQCESRSQSPSPASHGLDVEQQLQFVIGIPLHCLDEAVVSPPSTFYIFMECFLPLKLRNCVYKIMK